MDLRKTLVVAACLAGTVGLLHARQPSQGQPPTIQSPQTTFRTGVEAVQLDVTVLDKDRRPIRGLTAADFTVVEDGTPRPIVGVTAIDLPEPEPPATGWLRDVPADVVSNEVDSQRLVVILMDDANAGVSYGPTTDGSGRAGRDLWHEFYDPAVNVNAQRIARDVIDSLGPRDLAAVVFTYQGWWQNFTSNRQALREAAGSFIGKKIARPPQSPEVVMGGAQTGGPPLACDSKVPNCVMATLQHVAEILPATPPRRKVLVLISQGFLIPALEGESVSPTTLGPGVSDLYRLLRDLQRANVSIYAFDPSGLQVGREQWRLAQLLQTFAEQTGGRAVSQTNAPWDGVPQVFRETGTYYLVGFEPSAQDGRYRSVTVRVNRPGAQVIARSGYFAPGGKAEKSDSRKAGHAPASAAEAVLGSALPGGEIPLAVTTATLGTAGRDESTVLLTSSLRLTPSQVDAATPLELVATAYDDNWKPRGTATQTAQVTLPAGAAADVPVTLYSTLRLKPGRYELRVAAASGGADGHLFADVEVPEFSKRPLLLSEPVVGRQPDDASAAPFPGVPIVPTTSREFAVTDRMAVFFRVSAAKRRTPAETGVALRIEDADGRQAFGHAESLTLARGEDSLATGDYRFELPLLDLAPGPYLLTIDATLGEHTATRQLRFEVR
jgi:VWFA-related protein